MNNKGIKGMVKWLLENEIETRNDDDLLVALVDSATNHDIINLPYPVVMKNRASYGLFPVESITRARREIQEDYPELKGVDWVTRMRARKEKAYREYYREKKRNAR